MIRACLLVVSLAGAATEGGFRFPYTDWKESDLVGTVKRTTECVYLGKKGPRTECGSWREVRFDGSGLMVFRENGELPSEWSEQRTYTYEPDRRRIRVHHRGKTLFLLQFDPSGRIEEQQVLGDHLGRDTRYRIVRDEMGRKLSMTGFHRKPSGDSVFLEERYSYDDWGNLVRTSSRHENTGLSQEVRHYRYDSRGRILQRRTDRFWRDTSSFTTRYTYDRHGRVIVERQVGAGQVATTRISYDSVGNWVRKEVVIHGSPTHTTERTVEYYP